MSKLPKITIDDVMAAKPCWIDDHGVDEARAMAKKLFGRRKYIDALYIIDLGLSDLDKIWILTRPGFLNDHLWRKFAIACADRALTRERKAGREPDIRSWEAVRVAKRYLAGKATDDDLADAAAAAVAAVDAAYAVSAAYAAVAAAYAASAAYAAYADAAYAIAYAASAAAAAADAAAAYAKAADAAERKWQVHWLRKECKKLVGE